MKVRAQEMPKSVSGEEHLKGFKSKNEGNPLFKHKLIDHPEEDPQSEMKVVFRIQSLKSFKKSVCLMKPLNFFN